MDPSHGVFNSLYRLVQLLSVQKAGLAMLTPNTVRQWVRHGILEAEQIKEGRRNRYRIKQSVLDHYLHLK